MAGRGSRTRRSGKRRTEWWSDGAMAGTEDEKEDEEEAERMEWWEKREFCYN